MMETENNEEVLLDVKDKDRDPKLSTKSESNVDKINLPWDGYENVETHALDNTDLFWNKNQMEDFIKRSGLVGCGVSYESFMSENTTIYGNGCFRLTHSNKNEIELQKVHLNCIIKNVNDSRAHLCVKLKNCLDLQNAKHKLDINKKQVSNPMLQKGWYSVSSDKHGDYFSYIETLASSGLVEFRPGEFLYYDASSNCYYIQEEFNKLDNDFVFEKNFYPIPIPHLNAKFKGAVVDLGDRCDRGPESIQILCTFDLITREIKRSGHKQKFEGQFINIIGNHEILKTVENPGQRRTSSLGHAPIVADIIDQNILSPAVRDGRLQTCFVVDIKFNDLSENKKSVVFEHTLMTKKHVPYLFYVVKKLFNDEKYKDLANDWKEQFGELDDSLQKKVKDFLKSNLSPDLFNTKNWLEFYDILKLNGFSDSDFFKLKNAVGNVIYLNYDFFCDIDKDKTFDNIFWYRSKSYENEKKYNLLFDDVKQIFGHTDSNYVHKTNGTNLECVDTRQSVAYRNKRIISDLKNTSRSTTIIINLDQNYGFEVIHDVYMQRDGLVVNKDCTIVEPSVITTKTQENSDSNNIMFTKKMLNTEKDKKYDSKGTYLLAFTNLTENQISKIIWDKNKSYFINQTRNEKIKKEKKQMRCSCILFVAAWSSLFLSVMSLLEVIPNPKVKINDTSVPVLPWSLSTLSFIFTLCACKKVFCSPCKYSHRRNSDYTNISNLNNKSKYSEIDMSIIRSDTDMNDILMEDENVLA